MSLGKFKIYFFFLFFLISQFAYCDQPKENFYNEIRITDSQLLIKNIPYSSYSNEGKVQFINSQTSELLYEYNFFLKNDNFFTADAEYHVSIDDWFSKGHYGFYNDQILTFYKRGEVIKKVCFADLGIKIGRLTETVSHILWMEKAFVSNQYLYIWTTSSLLLVYDMTSGEAVSGNPLRSQEEFDSLSIQGVNQVIDFPMDKPKVNFKKTNIGVPLEQIFSKLLKKNGFENQDIRTVTFYTFEDGHIEIGNVENWNLDNLITPKQRLDFDQYLKDIRFIDFEFPEEYIKWGYCIKVDVKKTE